MIFTNSDGGARGNPGPGAIGIIVREDGKILAKHSEFIGKRVTNNIAEYEALIKALELALKYTKDEVTCVMDSELVYKQLMGKYKVNHPKMLELFLVVQRMQDKFKKVRYMHVAREDKFQILADELLNQEFERQGYKKYGKQG
ncbi:MAG: ribonuclease HI family protein [Nanoarchaeota archaeon]